MRSSARASATREGPARVRRLWDGKPVGQASALTSRVGTRKAMPVSLPLRWGSTTPTALAAPVEEGMMFWAAPAPTNQLVNQQISRSINGRQGRNGQRQRLHGGQHMGDWQLRGNEGDGLGEE